MLQGDPEPGAHPGVQFRTAATRAYLATPKKRRSPAGWSVEGWSRCREHPRKRRWVRSAAGEVVPGRIEPIRCQALISGDYAQ